MSGTILVERPGLFTTIQDQGRFGFADVGLTPSGALDRIALRLANALVGNSANEPALEILHAGPRLVVQADSIKIAIVGAQPKGLISFADGGQHPIEANRSITLARGDVISVDQLELSAVCILAVSGGFDLPLTLGSASTYTKASIGGVEGRALNAGDALPLRSPAPAGSDKQMSADKLGQLYQSGSVRVVLGPQDDAFSPETTEAFLSAKYEVGRESDRMGLRLDGPELPHVDAYEIPSDGISPGSIQVPGTKRPIIMLAERGTVGGYTKIATVASVDLPSVGRMSPGESIQFMAVSQSEAEALRREQEAAIEEIIGEFREAPPFGAPDFSLLGGVNLISGVWGTDRGE